MTTTMPAKQWPAGYVINERTVVPDPAMVEAFRGVPTPFVSDCMGRCIGAVGLRAFHGSDPMCGPALTVRVRPGDNLMIHKALELAVPGDVIVVDGGGDVTQSLTGGNMRATMIKRKLGGLVISGAIRDLAEWQEGGMPVYALANVHRGPSKDGPGQINIPISCAGMAVMPGDLILGDLDGVVAIPPAELAELLPRVRKQQEWEKKMRADIANGTTDPDRFNTILRKKGCPV
jgi:RraA family protein